MFQKTKKLFLTFFLTLIATYVCSVHAKLKEDIYYRQSTYHINYTINTDASFTEEHISSKKILKEKALKYLKNASISYSTSIQTAEVVEAYTLKADGKKIEVPKDSYQLTVRGGKGSNKALFSDRTSLSLVFPNVEVGDSVYFHYKLIAKEPIFPEHFSENMWFGTSSAYDDVMVTVDAPESMQMRTVIRSFKEEENITKNGRKIMRWSWQNPQPIIDEREDYSVYNGNEHPGYMISTFKSHEEIAAAYGARATPKATVTQRVQNLADKIAGDKTETREIARSLYDWVARNISYAGNCVGLGAVVPHDVDFILDNMMGDCKDHATLLQALFSAKGIDSTQALINSGAAYELPEIPVVSMVNHVISYIPSLDLFLDSTSPSTPFGMLPFSDQDKDVLLVWDRKPSIMKTPVQKIGENTQVYTSSLIIDETGAASGETTVKLAGVNAAYARENMRNVSQDDEKEFIKNNFKQYTPSATGTFTKEDPEALLDTYKYSAKYQVKDLFTFAKTGAINIYPRFFNYDSISHYVSQAKLKVSEYDTTCSSGKSTELITYQLPPNIKVLSIPDDVELSNQYLSYSAHYQLEGNILTVSRTFDDRTVGNVCSPEIGHENKKLLIKALENYTEQLIYKKQSS